MSRTHRFASLELASPLIVAPVSGVPDEQACHELVSVGVGAILVTPPDRSEIVEAELQDAETSDRARRDARDIAWRELRDAYYGAIASASAAGLPVIARVPTPPHGAWVRAIAPVIDAGAVAVLVEPLDAPPQTIPAEQIERTLIRSATSLAERTERPIIFSVPVGTRGMEPLGDALSATGASALLLTPPEFLQAVDHESGMLTPHHPLVRTAAFVVVTSTAALLSSRLAADVAVTIPATPTRALADATIAGARACVIEIDGPVDQSIGAIRAQLESWRGATRRERDAAT